MGLVDNLKAAGFKPEANSDGEWKPLVGTYKVKCTALRPELAEDGSKYYQVEWDILETLEGDPKRESKFADFRKRYYVTGDKSEKNLKSLLNDFFTCGVELDTTSDETLEASFEKAIGAEGYARAWGWTPQGKDTAQQSFVIQQAKIAEKKRSKESLPF